jgi:hypothetical protein
MRTYNQTPMEVEQQIVKLYQEGNSSVILSKQFKIHPSTVLQIVRRNGGKTRTTKETSKRYTFNENYFEKINTEDKAYWLGFILADGCICRNDLVIVLKESDENHIEKFIKNIEGNNEYQIIDNNHFGNHKCVRLSIRSKKIFSDLQTLGITPNKSLTASIPKNITNNLLRHFWRGVIDGDGFICEYNQQKGKYKYSYLGIGLTGSKNVVDEFIDFIKNKLDIKLKLEKEKNVWRTKTACDNAIKISSLLYDNSVIYLNRKKEKYENYVQNANIT